MKRARILPIYQPIRWIFLLCITFGFLSFRYSLATPIITIALVIITVLLFCFRKSFPQFTILSIFSCILILTVLHTGYTFHIKDKDLLQYQDQTVSVTMEIREIDFEVSGQKGYIADVRLCQGKKTGGAVQLITSDNFAFQVGEVLECNVHCSEIQEYSFSFPTRLYMRSQGVLLKAEFVDDNICVTDYKTHFIRENIQALRSILSARFDSFDYQTASFFRALILGDRDGIATQTERDFSKIGASHILSISGLHFAIICGIFYKLLSLFVSTRKICLSIYALFLVFFCLLSGCSPSAVRACGMLLFATLVSACYMESDPISVLSFVGTVMIAIRPYYLINISFLLSFAATFGILYFLPTSEKKSGSFWKKIKDYLLFTIYASASSFLFTLPFIAFFFQKASLLSIATSLVLIPLCTLCVNAGLIALLLPLPFRAIFTPILSLPSKVFFFFVERFSRQNDITLFLSSPTVKIGMLVFLIVLAIFLLFLFQKKKTMLVSLILICAVVFSINTADCSRKKTPQIYTYSQKDAIVFFLHEGENDILILSSDVTWKLLQTAMEDYQLQAETDHIDYLIIDRVSSKTEQLLNDFCTNYYVKECYYPENISFPQESHLLRALQHSRTNGVSHADKIDTPSIYYHTLEDRSFVLTVNGTGFAYFSNTWNTTQSDIIFYLTYRDDPRLRFLFFDADASLIPQDDRIIILDHSDEIKTQKFFLTPSQD